MSSPKGFSAEHFYLVVKPSRLHMLLSLLVHIAALAALWLNAIFWLSLQIALTLALLASLSHFLSGWTQLRKVPVVEQLVYRNEAWVLGFSDGRWQQAQLRSPLHVGYFFVILGFSLKGEELKIVVGRDACEKNAYRRLTVFVRRHGPKLLQRV
ncbi:MAG: protein YgfX [Candidatus Azotimanducaceae bacterium WSBS_2022_MAG_OTU7]